MPSPMNLVSEPGGISEPARALLGSLINRLFPSDRPRLRAYYYQLIGATTTLRVARVIGDGSHNWR